MQRGFLTTTVIIMDSTGAHSRSTCRSRLVSEEGSRRCCGRFRSLCGCRQQGKQTCTTGTTIRSSSGMFQVRDHRFVSLDWDTIQYSSCR